MNEVKKVVLAYSGGLDTSVIVRWLIETYRCEVICFAADIGQKEELSGLREKAIKTGAAKIYIDDLQEEFARDFVFPALRANAIYEGTYLLGTSLARPLIAKTAAGDREARRGRCGLPRRHGKRERPGAVRADLHRPQPRHPDHLRLERRALDVSIRAPR